MGDGAVGVSVDVEEPCVAVVVALLFGVWDLFDGSVGVTADVDVDEPSVAVAVGGGVGDGFDGAVGVCEDFVVEPCEPCVVLGGALCEGVGVGPAAAFSFFFVPAWSPVCLSIAYLVRDPPSFRSSKQEESTICNCSL